MNILFGTLPWNHWTDSVKKLPYNIHIIELEDIDTVVKYITDNNIDVIIGLLKQQNYFINDYYDILVQHVNHIFYNVDRNTIDLLNDKQKFNTFLKDNNFADYIPTTYISCINGKQLMHNKFTFPCIYKLCIGSGGSSSTVLETNGQLCKKLLDKTANYFIQEYVIDQLEYSAHLYILDGIIKFSRFYCAKNSKKNYIQKGRMIKYRSVEVPQCVNIFQEIFTKLNYTGFACIDYKLKNGSPKIFEINPRPGATIVTNIDDFNKLIQYLLST